LLGDASVTAANAHSSVTSGPVTVKGTLSGAPSALQAQGTASARDVAAGPDHVRSLHASYAMRDLGARPSGLVALTADTLSAGPVPVRQATVGLRINNGAEAA